MPVPPLPEELWDYILRSFLCRVTDVHINMEDGRHDVTFFSCRGYRRGDSFLVELGDLPRVDRASFRGEWGNYYRLRMFRDAEELVLAPVTTEVANPMWAAVGRPIDRSVPMFHGHAVSRMFRRHFAIDAVILTVSLAAHAEDQYPNAFLTARETPFAKRGVGARPCDMAYDPSRCFEA